MTSLQQGGDTDRPHLLIAAGVTSIDIVPGGGVACYEGQRTLLSYPSNEPPSRLSID
jgi:hypothetical protein